MSSALAAAPYCGQVRAAASMTDGVGVSLPIKTTDDGSGQWRTRAFPHDLRHLALTRIVRPRQPIDHAVHVFSRSVLAHLPLAVEPRDLDLDADDRSELLLAVV